MWKSRRTGTILQQWLVRKHEKFKSTWKINNDNNTGNKRKLHNKNLINELIYGDNIITHNN